MSRCSRRSDESGGREHRFESRFDLVETAISIDTAQQSHPGVMVDQGLGPLAINSETLPHRRLVVIGTLEQVVRPAIGAALARGARELPILSGWRRDVIGEPLLAAL